MPPKDPRSGSGETQEIAEAVAQTMRNTAKVRAQLAETYRRLAAASTGEKARTYLAHAQRYQELAQRARRFARDEDQVRGNLDGSRGDPARDGAT